MEAIKMGLSIFSRQQKIRLLPFVVTSVFFLLQPYEPGSTFFGTIFKILPIISLIAYVIMERSQYPTKTKSLNLETVIPEDAYSFCVCLGLGIAMIGDIFVAFTYTMWLGGLLFMVVYLSYVIAIEVGGRHRGYSSCTWFFALLYVNTFLSVQGSSDSFFVKGFLLLYFIPLFLAGWKAASAFEENPGDKSVLLGCIGASLFILSDILVILDHHGYPIPFSAFLYMLTYYGAQFGWATSTSSYS